MEGRIVSLVTAAVLGALAAGMPAAAQSGLVITYGSQGIQTLSYQGTTLENVGASSADAFHIWHMKMTDLSGNLASCAQCGWGENHNGRNWNAATHTWTYNFSWGSIATQFVQVGDTLNMNVTETNLPSSGYILDGAVIYPFVLHFPQLPAGFVNAGYAQLAYETTGPGVTPADFGAGDVIAVDPDAAKPLYSGFLPAGQGIAYTPIVASTTPDGLATFLPHNDRPVQPGQTDTFTVSLRFAPSGTTAGSLASDAYQNWAQTWPAQLKWTDRRALGTVYIASSPSGNINQPGGFPNNPRRYFDDGKATDFDVTTPAGLVLFQNRVLQLAAANVVNLKNLNAQGVVTWDIEGQQYAQPTSYVCSPDQVARVAPEMESVIANSASPYMNMKLDDAYFLIMRSAGFRVGVCVRPQHFAINPDGTAQQTYLPSSAIEAELLGKMQYAHNRWGATLFYVDSTVDTNGGVLDASIFQQLQAALPDSLIMPEESTPKHYAYTAPFQSFIDRGLTGTDPDVRNYYPNAFTAILINDVAASSLAASQTILTASVKGGDVLMGHAEYWQANNPTIVQIYQNAGVTQPSTPAPPAPTPPAPTPPTTTPPTPATPVTILSPVGGATLSGAITVAAQIAANLDAAGSYLMVDGAEVGTARERQSPFLYALDTTTLSNGQHTLQVWAHDTNNNTDLSAPLVLVVANTPASSPAPSPPVLPTPAPPVPTSAPVATGAIVITSPSPGVTLTGTVSITAQVSVNLDAAGSYLMVDGAEIGTSRQSQPPYAYTLNTLTLANGQHTLQVWGHDTSNSVDLSATVPVTVANSSTPPASLAPALPVSSSYPLSLTYPVSGQGISGLVNVAATITQSLDAAGSYLLVDGAEYGTQRIGSAPFVYPLNATMLTPGQHTLQVWAHDTNNDTLLSNPVVVAVPGP